MSTREVEYNDVVRIGCAFTFVRGSYIRFIASPSFLYYYYNLLLYVRLGENYKRNSSDDADCAVSKMTTNDGHVIKTQRKRWRWLG